MSTALEKLKSMTKVVADTGDFEAMDKFKPEVSIYDYFYGHDLKRKIFSKFEENLFHSLNFTLSWLIQKPHMIS